MTIYLIPIISSLRFTEIHLGSRRLCNFLFVLSDLILSGFVHIIYSVYERHYLLSEIRSLHTSRRVHHAHREVRQNTPKQNRRIIMMQLIIMTAID